MSGSSASRSPAASRAISSRSEGSMPAALDHGATPYFSHTRTCSPSSSSTSTSMPRPAFSMSSSRMRRFRTRFTCSASSSSDVDVVPVHVVLHLLDQPHGQAHADQLPLVGLVDEHVDLAGAARPARVAAGLQPGLLEHRPGIGHLRDLDEAARLQEGRHRHHQDRRTPHHALLPPASLAASSR